MSLYFNLCFPCNDIYFFKWNLHAPSTNVINLIHKTRANKTFLRCEIRVSTKTKPHYTINCWLSSRPNKHNYIQYNKKKHNVIVCQPKPLPLMVLSLYVMKCSIRIFSVSLSNSIDGDRKIWNEKLLNTSQNIIHETNCHIFYSYENIHYPDISSSRSYLAWLYILSVSLSLWEFENVFINNHHLVIIPCAITTFVYAMYIIMSGMTSS